MSPLFPLCMPLGGKEAGCFAGFELWELFLPACIYLDSCKYTYYIRPELGIGNSVGSLKWLPRLCPRCL